MRKLSKRSVLKKKKQQLCDRINQCKSLKELKGWERTFSYHPVLKDDFDWDYEFLLDLIEFKLKECLIIFIHIELLKMKTGMELSVIRL